MKHATLHMQYNEISGILLENCEDFLEYTKFAEKEIELGIRSVFKSPEPVERWDHICRDPSLFSGIFCLSYLDAKFNGGNPLLKIDNVIDRKYQAIIKCLLEGDRVIMNKVGGWCPTGKHPVTIHENKDYEPILYYYIPKVIKENVKGGMIPAHLNTTTKWINLENDPDTCKYTFQNLKELDRYFSSIRNMIHWRKEDFEKVFKEFKENGGEGLWLYTTGQDVEQMYLYTDTAIECGINKFIFNFNAGESKNILDFINVYNDNVSIEFEYNFV